MTRDWMADWRVAEGIPEGEPRDRGVRRKNDPFGEYDLLGRRQPRQLGVPDFLLFVARIDPTRVRRVPDLAVSEEGADDDGAFALVTCPCGARPVVRSRLVCCDGCQRHYVYVGAVWVAYGDMPVPT